MESQLFIFHGNIIYTMFSFYNFNCIKNILICVLQIVLLIQCPGHIFTSFRPVRYNFINVLLVQAADNSIGKFIGLASQKNEKYKVSAYIAQSQADKFHLLGKIQKGKKTVNNLKQLWRSVSFMEP